MDALFWQGIEFIDRGDPHGLLSHLRAYPHLVGATAPEEDPPRPSYFAHPGLIHYLPDNPVRNGRVSPACVDCLDVLVGMGTALESLNETLALACSSQSLADSGQDEGLITALIEAGASPEAGLDAALGHKMENALMALLHSGIALTLPVLIALDRDISFASMKETGEDELQKAIAVASIWGKAKNIPNLIEAGADPNAFCPEGFHAHSTPLHQAVMADSVPCAMALVLSGADKTITDKIWEGTPHDWAEHEGKEELAAILDPESPPRHPGKHLKP